MSDAQIFRPRFGRETGRPPPVECGRIYFGPTWPEPHDVAEFLEQARQYVRAADADDRPFRATAALLLTIDTRNGRFVVGDIDHNLLPTEVLAALEIVKRRFVEALDPAGEFDPGEDPPTPDAA